MNILGVESSQGQCSLTLLKDETCTSELNIQARKHSDNILSMLDALLNKTHLSVSDINLLAYSSGPGSFTGLRIGAAFTQALAYAHDLQAVAVSSLHLLAVAGLKKHPKVDVIVCCVDARVNGVYWAVFDIQKQSLKIERRTDDALSHAPHQDLEALFSDDKSGKQKDEQNYDQYLYLGDGIEVLMEQFNIAKSEQHIYDINLMPHAEDLVYIAKDSTQPRLKAEEISPVYLRGADAWKKMTD